jgi:hypothetical protein
VTYHVKATRDGKFYLLEITGPYLTRPGVTQCTGVSDAVYMARDWLATALELTEEEAEELSINVEWS